MLTVEIKGIKYNIEFTFAAADESDLIQSMFKIVSGAYFFGNGKEESMAAAMMNGTAAMVGDLPKVCKQAFYAGLKEHHAGISYDEAVDLMKAYMRENTISFNSLFQMLKEQMEKDGFFELTGIVEMMQEMTKDEETEAEKKLPKVPQDHLKKSTGIQ